MCAVDSKFQHMQADIKVNHRINVGYQDPLECYQRIVRAILSIGRNETYLMPREVDILSAMCLAVRRGQDINNHEEIRKLMRDEGMGHVSAGTFRNYKSNIKKAGWLVEKMNGKYGLHMLLEKAVENGGIVVGVFLKGEKGS